MALLQANGSPLLGRRNRGAAEEDVDITPMIDITFLMLIFFLVSSTPDEKTSVELPEALHGKAVSQRESVVFTIGSGGLGVAPVFASDGKLPDAALSEDLVMLDEQVREAVQKGVQEGKSNVVIKADRAVAYRDVARIIKSVSAAPNIQLHLAVLDNE